MKLAQPYRWLDRHSRMQMVVRVLAGLEYDSYRQPLHYLYIVARGVFRRKQAETVATRTGHMLDTTAIVAPEGIDMNRYLFPAMHAGELGLLKIRGHPDIVGLGHEHQGLAR